MATATVKIEMAEQKEKRKAKEARQLERLIKERNRPKKRWYYAYFILIIAIVYIVDEVASQIGTQMQSIIATQLFAPLFGEEVAVARMSLIGQISLAAYILAMLYRPLSDKYGRRPFLIINTLGMAVGMFLIGISTGIPVYLIGTLVVSFFVPHDMQAIYIQECAPAEKRATTYSVIKAVSTLGMFLIPLLRRIFIPGSDLTNWRFVYIAPAVIGVLVTIFAIIFVRESDVFLDNKIRQLKMTDEERAAEAHSAEEKTAQGGIIHAGKYIFKHKQLLWIALVAGVVGFGAVIPSYYETVMSYGYAQKFIGDGMTLAQAISNGLATPYVNKALTLFAFGSAFCQFIPGFIADAIGRKKAVLCMAGAAILSYVLFWVGCNRMMNPYLVGAFAGLAVGAHWATGDLVALISTESSPTNLRASIETTRVIISYVISLLSTVGSIVLINVLGDAKIAIVCLTIALIGYIVGILMMMFKVKDTKGVDMSTVSAKDFE